MESAEKLYIKVLKSSGEMNNIFFRLDIPMMIRLNMLKMKDKQISEQARKEGNLLFTKNNHTTEEHEAIIKLYNKSIAHGSPGSEELAFAYGNRSALLVHLNKYEESIEDIERALKMTQSYSFRIKLLCRKAQALRGLGLSDDRCALEKAKYFFKKISDNNKAKETLRNMIAKTETALKMEAKPIGEKNLSSSEEELLKEKFKGLQISGNICDSVTVNHSEKCGRFLTASCDFEPGDIIFNEEFYAATLNTNVKQYTHCDNCLQPSWLLIPCSECTWAMFCSEKCKTEACENHHNVECTLVSFIQLNESMIIEGRLPIRLLLTAIKEAGNIENLRAEVKKIDNETEANSKEFFTPKNFERKFTAAYRLKSFMNTNEEDNPVIVGTSILLIKILYKSMINIKSVEDMLKNKDAIFIGSLLLKFFKMKVVNAYAIEKSTDVCDHPNAVGPLHSQNHCKETGGGLCLIGSLINHSCAPNISRTIVNNNSLVFYALKPIKAGEPLSDSYQSSFYQQSKLIRLERLMKYQFICDCDACKNDWPVYDLEQAHKMLHKYLIKIDSSRKLSNRILSHERIIKHNRMEDVMIGHEKYPRIIKDLSDCLKKVFKVFPLNSQPACMLYSLLQWSYDDLYNVKKLDYLKCN